MTNYEIRTNDQYNSKEVYFEGKPSADTRTALKALKMRWNPTKGCWYGFVSETDIISAITGTETELGGTISEGYLGATRWDGNKSKKYLHGADLSKAIREELKAHGLKGITVRTHTYTGGQNITLTFATTPADYITFEEYKAIYSYNDFSYWVQTPWGKSISRDDWFELDGDKQQEVLIFNAEGEYNNITQHGGDINHYYIDKYNYFTEGFKAKLHKANAILDTYHYDDSNSMVDYFDTNFYRDFYIKPVQA